MYLDIEYLRLRMEERARERRSIELANRYRRELQVTPRAAGPMRRMLELTSTTFRRLRPQRSGGAAPQRSETPNAGAPV